MKVLRSLCALAITMLAANSMWAQQTQKHDHPLDKATTEKYLTEYLGITNYSGSNWSYTSTSNKTADAVAPTGIEAGEVIFVQVNDYWRGSNWGKNGTILSSYEQIQYGVKQIDKVTQHAKIGSGDLYHFDATTNRFFFAIRTSSMYVASSDSWERISWGSSTRYLSEATNKKPFRWYNEFSSTSNTSGDGWDSMTAAYDDLKDGFFYPVPHSCSNSLEKNHFTSLYDKTSIGETYSVSAMLYVPTKANGSTNQKNDEFPSTAVPQVFFYINKLTGDRIDYPQGTDCKFAADLNWKTSFDIAPTSFKPYTKGTEGVKEVSKIYRKIEGTDKFVLVAENIIDLKNYQDTTLPNPGTDGYDVTYYVLTEAITCDANGNITGTVIGKATTNQITFHVPGSEEKYFELSLTNNFNSEFTPIANKMGESYNKITNVITSAPNRNTPELSDIKVGDKLELKRMTESGETVVNQIEITAISGSSFTYNLNGTSKTSKWSKIDELLATVANYTDNVNSVPGVVYDSRYKLVYTTGTKSYESNVVTSKGMSTEVKAEKLYRSGTPDVVTDADKKEVYTCRVSFKPVPDNRVAHYHIWMNGTDKLMRVGQSGEDYTLVGKDANGQFNVDLGPIYTDDYGFLNVLVDAEVSKRANPEELQGNENPFINNDLFFTVEVCATGDNTYGNIDATENYKGYNSELVYNSRANIFYGEGSVTGYFRAEVDWIRAFDPKFMDDDDVIKEEPAFFTVHRKLAGETVYSPLKNFYIEDAETGYKPYLEEAGEEAFQFTPELIEELSLKQKVGFKAIDIFEKKDWTVSNAFPAMYYVKAYFKPETDSASKAMRKAHFVNASEQYIVKNSNPTTTVAPIPTAVEDVNVSEVVSVKYYNLMGVEVMNPAAGEIVIARKQYANGTTASKVIKM